MKALLFAAALAFAGAAQADTVDFTGYYNVTNWTAIPGNGYINVGEAPAEVQLISGNQNSGDDVFTDFYIMADHTSWFTFDWTFESDDDPFFQAFGYLLGDSPATLAFNDLTNAGDAFLSGSESVYVEQGQYFGFRVISFDETTLNATSTITNFVVTAVPEPGALALVCLALMAAGSATRAARTRR